ncbi:MAG TPA: phosphoribosylaminoimidazolesuccinocarboxamide synthase [Limnochordia bacterium]
MFDCPELPWPRLQRGKVRELFDLGQQLLMVATDRLSAFDVILSEPIPQKGTILTEMSARWFRATREIVPNHLLSTEIDGLGLPADLRAALAGRSSIVRRARRIDVECVVRGYLAGSAWAEYQARGEVCGVRLPAGLQLSSRLPEPIFTPALKNDVGHDENVPFERVAALVGADTARRLAEFSLALYRFGAERAAQAGIILADTKFEFGWWEGELILIDELFTPDSSRFWPQEAYREGAAIESLDKQPVRDYLSRIGWDKTPPAPPLPPEVVAATSARYAEALRRLRAVLA